jgi:hypothetical protein
VTPLVKTGEPIPEGHHVLRYIRRKHVDHGMVNGGGFLTRPNEDAPSVNWMECFNAPIQNQVNEISARRRLRYERRAVLVRLNVGRTKQYVEAIAKSIDIAIVIQFLHDPLPAEGSFPEDPSHAIIQGVPIENTPEAEMIKDLFADCILDIFEVVPD